MVIAPSFDHRSAGTSEEDWAAEYATATRTGTLDGVGQLVVVVAHPDDETLGAAGLMNLAARRGVPVTVLVASLGEHSHPDSPTHRPEDLRRLRRSEVLAAVSEAAPSATVEILELPDGSLSQHIPELTEAIRRQVPGPDVLIASTWVDDGHPDHAAVGVAAATVALAAGAACWQFPIWAWHWARPGDGALPELVLLDLDLGAQQAKTAAVGRHVSQVQSLSPQAGDEPVLHEQFLTHFLRDFEAFVATPARPVGAESLSPAFFDEFYSGPADPWGFQTRWYEERKRALTMASLPRPRFRSAFEPGCAIGVLTEQLAGRCDRLLATDVTDAPLQNARRRLTAAPNVTLEKRRIPTEWPDGTFDLIVLSEVGYYCGSADLAELAGLAGRSLTADGVLIACHWRHPVAEYPQTGDQVHRALRGGSGLHWLGGYQDADFLLDVLVPAPARSVAQVDGLAR